MTPRTLNPARTLEEASQALDFDVPLDSGDPRYVDLSPLRGNDSRKYLRRSLERKQGGTFCRLALLSHRGAGKTTELRRLSHELREQFIPIHLEANTELDPIEFELEDLLLVLCRTVVEKMRALELPLEDELLQRVYAQLAEIVKTTSAGASYVAEAKTEGKLGATLAFLGLTGHLTALNRRETQERTEVREKLRQYPAALMEAVNQLLEEARRRLKTKFGRELLIFIDNMDRYAPEAMDKLVVQQGDRFRELWVDLVITPPIALLYKPLRGDLQDGFQIEVMCSARLHGETDRDYSTVQPESLKLLLDALGRRVDLDTLIPDGAVRHRLVVASGGSIRELLELGQTATLFADTVIDAAAVKRAVDRKKAMLRDRVNVNGWARTLAQIARDRQISAVEGPDAQRHLMDVLFYRLAFKYNGTSWYDIHPLVAELPEVAKLLRAEAG